LEELKATIEKKKQDYHAVIGLLKVLKKKQMNSELIKKTLIGKTVRSFCQLQPSRPDLEDEAK
jgi:hypothetical protein